MMKFAQILLCYGLLLSMLFVVNEARPGSAAESSADNDALETPDEDMRGSYSSYELPVQAIYPNIPMDRLQMLLAQYRPTYSNYYHTPSYGNMNELYRSPESKRQVRYRQCYFNPISCFKK